MADTFSIGDSVRLKSGGPGMTVEQTEADGDGRGTPYVHCAWFDGKEKKIGSFPAATVEAIVTR